MNTNSHKRAQAGFTLYELLITVVIVGVVLSFGLANLGDFTRNGRMVATANDLHAAFHLARSEAARSKTNITICASADAMGAATCGGTWDQGYIVFVDTDGDIQRAGATETVLRRHDVAETGISLGVEFGASYFSYAASGLGRGDVAGPSLVRVAICDERGNVPGLGGNSAARLFVVTPLGRATIVRDKNAIDLALPAMGVSCP